MERIIQQKLCEIESQHKVKVLYACESGSRAWGFASGDSDYDVRFVYIHQKDWYTGIDDLRDVIELPVNEVLDVSGWDIRKALRLFRKSNAPLFEWLQSPVVYKKDDYFLNHIKHLSPDYFILRSGFHHYLSMAKSCFENELQGETVKVKKYFYALRPILACKWIVDRKEMPPMEFSALRELMHNDIQPEIEKLISLKAEGDEKLFMAKNFSINEYLWNTINYCEARGKELPECQNETETLNEFFRELLQK